MRKLQKAAVVAATIGSLGLVGAGTAYAHGHDGWDGWHHGKHGGRHVNIRQSTWCKSHDMNIDVLGHVGALNGLLGNALNGKGHPGGQGTRIGSRMGCNNSIF